MNPADSIFLIFWMFQIIKLIGMFTGFFSKREFLTLQVVTSTLGLVGTITYEAVHGVDWQWPFVIVWAILFRLDYRKWKKHKDDDDDDHRHARRSWVKNHLPKPKTKAIPQPI